MQFKNDYKLTPADSARIECSNHCGAQATTGQNNGGAPFWYHCDACAEHCRQTGHFYITDDEALARVKSLGGNVAVYHPETHIAIAHYRVAKIHEIGFEWEGIGKTWQEAFANITGIEVTA